jgi:hypothetical protein
MKDSNVPREMRCTLAASVLLKSFVSESARDERTVNMHVHVPRHAHRERATAQIWRHMLYVVHAHDIHDMYMLLLLLSCLLLTCCYVMLCYVGGTGLEARSWRSPSPRAPFDDEELGVARVHLGRRAPAHTEQDLLAKAADANLRDQLLTSLPREEGLGFAPTKREWRSAAQVITDELYRSVWGARYRYRCGHA